MDLNGKAGLSFTNPALPKEFQGEEKSAKPIFFPELLYRSVAASLPPPSKKCNNLITSLIEWVQSIPHLNNDQSRKEFIP
ncbi:MAG: hypothetical protein R2788_16070 [Saprospiraceae bacterium]